MRVLLTAARILNVQRVGAALPSETTQISHLCTKQTSLHERCIIRLLLNSLVLIVYAVRFLNYLVFDCGMSVVLIKNEDDDDDDDEYDNKQLEAPSCDVCDVA